MKRSERCHSLEAAGPTSLNVPSTESLRLNAAWPRIEVVYEDADLLALNKPAGLLVAPDRWDKSRDNLASLLQEAILSRRPWVLQRGLTYLANAHRLDFHTSGVTLYAKTQEALRNLARQFRERHPRKTYVALVQGTPSQESILVDKPLGPHPVRLGLAAVDTNRGKAARTLFTVIERFRGYALVKAEPETGRMHQIRVHLQEIGHPLVADADYGNGLPLLLSRLKKHYKMKPEGERPLISRPALHAEGIVILHPSTNEPVTIEAAWPKDLTVAVKYLRRFAK